MFNANHEPLEFTLPEAKWGRKWVELLETDDKGDEMDEERTGSELRSRAKVRVQAWSMALLRRLA
jgi:hypothetical protein